MIKKKAEEDAIIAEEKRKSVTQQVQDTSSSFSVFPTSDTFPCFDLQLYCEFCDFMRQEYCDLKKINCKFLSSWFLPACISFEFLII